MPTFPRCLLGMNNIETRIAIQLDLIHQSDLPFKIIMHGLFNSGIPIIGTKIVIVGFVCQVLKAYRLWKAKIGTGFSSNTIAEGRVYSMGNSGRGRGTEKDTIFCFDALTAILRPLEGSDSGVTDGPVPPRTAHVGPCSPPSTSIKIS